MLSRLAALENESRELHRDLDLEKQRSRIDTLTRVANRVSFDERFAEELARWNRFRHPVAILVWDIDRFKSINDAIGIPIIIYNIPLRRRGIRQPAGRYRA